jgi:hypothetical protein
MKTELGRVDVIIGDIGDIGEGKYTSPAFRRSLLHML